MKKSFWIFCFALSTIICLCFIKIPQEYVWVEGGYSSIIRYQPSTARMGSIISQHTANSYTAQPVVDKPYTYTGQKVVYSPSAMVHSYAGGIGGNVGGSSSIVVHNAVPTVALPQVVLPQSPRAASASGMHKPMMRKNGAARPSTLTKRTTDKVPAPMIASHALSLGYEAAASYMTPAVYRAPGSGLDNALNNWLISGSGSGALLYGDATTGYYYDMALLQDLFNQMQANGDMPGMTWEQFIDWFTHGSQNRHFAPMGDAWWLLALLALGYAIVVRCKYNRQTMKME